MQASSYGSKLRLARAARGLSPQELADRAEVALGTVEHLEAGQGLPQDVETLHALARVLQVPPVYFIARNYPEYVSAWYFGLTEPEQRRFRSLPLHERLGAVIHELQLLWRDHFSLARLASQVPLLAADDLSAVLQGALQLSGEQWQAIYAALGLPQEFGDDLTLEIPTPEMRRYLRVINLARAMGITPEELAQTLGKALM